jgi:hypothetical protein
MNKKLDLCSKLEQATRNPYSTSINLLNLIASNLSLSLISLTSSSLSLQSPYQTLDTFTSSAEQSQYSVPYLFQVDNVIV